MSLIYPETDFAWIFIRLIISHIVIYISSFLMFSTPTLIAHLPSFILEICAISNIHLIVADYLYQILFYPCIHPYSSMHPKYETIPEVK